MNLCNFGEFLCSVEHSWVIYRTFIPIKRWKAFLMLTEIKINLISHQNQYIFKIF